MRLIKRFNADHKDVVHDVAYDFYGKRLATCSSDRTIRVWDLGPQNEWICSEQWTAHTASILRVAWSHPEYGQLLASCSDDRTVSIWEETQVSGGRKWVQRHKLHEAKQSVVDVSFAPRHYGLKLVTCSEDGMTRVYEAGNVTNLSEWRLVDSLQLHARTAAWNPSRFDQQMICLGCRDGSLRWVCWSEQAKKWAEVHKQVCHHGKTVHDVKWAPCLGRSQHWVASAGVDGQVCIWAVSCSAAGGAAGEAGVSAQLLTYFTEHRSEVWRLQWNVSGTVLASSGDDGTVRLWKADLSGKWSNVSTVEAPAQDDMPVGM